MERKEQIKLGYLQYFPINLEKSHDISKVGGEPDWLISSGIQRSSLICEFCKQPLSFFMQIYAPFSQFFHAKKRTLYLFICIKGECIKRGSVRLFRTQSSSNASASSGFDYMIEEKEEWCNLQKSSTSSEPSDDGWETSKKKKKKDRKNKEEEKNDTLLEYYKWNEFTLTIEDEVRQNCEGKKKVDEKVEEIYQRYLIDQEKELSLSSSSSSSSDGYDIKDDSDVDDIDLDGIWFDQFYAWMNENPSQCLRYNCGGGKPLWVCDEGRVEGDGEDDDDDEDDDGEEGNVKGSTAGVCGEYGNIKTNDDRVSAAGVFFNEKITCPYCGERRTFEFQVMPPILYFLDVENNFDKDAPDFGTIVCYTCPNSCESSTVASPLPSPSSTSGWIDSNMLSKLGCSKSGASFFLPSSSSHSSISYLQQPRKQPVYGGYYEEYVIVQTFH